MLTNLTVKHFKSIENADIEFDQTTMFVGNNGSGKTNVVDAIRFPKDASINGLDRAFSDRHGVESVRQWSPTRPFRISLTATIDEPEFWAKYSVGIDSAKGHFQVINEEMDVRGIIPWYNEEDETVQLHSCQRMLLHRDKAGTVERRTWQTEPASGDPTTDLSGLLLWMFSSPVEETDKIEQSDELILHTRRWEHSSLRQRLSSFQAYSIYPNTLRTPQEPSNETYLAPEGRNLASVFKRMRRTKKGQEALVQIVEAMRAILPNLDRISILSVGGYLVPQFHMVEQSHKSHVFNVSQMSDGTLRVLGLLTALYQEPRPPIVALEEPEQTVNPGILTVLADSIKEVAQRTQVIVTTHSPHLLDQFPPECIRAVELEAGLSRVARIAPTQMDAVRERLFTIGELLVSEGLHA